MLALDVSVKRTRTCMDTPTMEQIVMHRDNLGI